MLINIVTCPSRWDMNIYHFIWATFLPQYPVVNSCRVVLALNDTGMNRAHQLWIQEVIQFRTHERREFKEIFNFIDLTLEGRDHMYATYRVFSWQLNPTCRFLPTSFVFCITFFPATTKISVKIFGQTRMNPNCQRLQACALNEAIDSGLTPWTLVVLERHLCRSLSTFLRLSISPFALVGQVKQFLIC